jgi:hypothetical protein
MLKVRFGVAPRLCRACLTDQKGLPKMTKREDLLNMIIVCQYYPCEMIEDQSDNKRGC